MRLVVGLSFHRERCGGGSLALLRDSSELGKGGAAAAKRTDKELTYEWEAKSADHMN